MTKEIKNIGLSIKTKLWKIASENKRDKNDNQIYQLLTVRYIQERLLYRLCRSRFCDKFYLKGGALLFAYEKFNARPTMDIDFLGHHISRGIEEIKSVFTEIVTADIVEDGISFDAGRITAEEITVNKEYHGVRLTLPARIDTIIQTVSMDIGFGDVVTPGPQTIDYPTLIDSLPVPTIYAYSLETVVAEKFEAMIALSVDNSRMKDFFDVYRILKYQEIDEDILAQAIEATFFTRQTQLVENPALFTPEFAKDIRRNNNWRAFLKRIKWKEKLDFGEVCNFVTERLKPYYEKIYAKLL